MGRIFSGKLNPRSPDETVVIPGATEDLDIGTSPPTKNNKQHSGCYQHPQEQEDNLPGCDNLEAELFKALE